MKASSAPALRKELYYPPFSAAGRFGLVCGQMRARRDRFAKNAGWYNRDGEKLGWGDLSYLDIRRIVAGLRKGELFLILSESDSFWAFVRKIGTHGGNCKVDRRERAPGKRFAAEHALYILAPKKRFLVDRHGSFKRKIWKTGGLVFEVIGRDRVRELLALR